MIHEDTPMIKIITKENMKISENENVEVGRKIATDIFETLAPYPEEHRIIGQTLIGVSEVRGRTF